MGWPKRNQRENSDLTWAENLRVLRVFKLQLLFLKKKKRANRKKDFLQAKRSTLSTHGKWGLYFRKMFYRCISACYTLFGVVWPWGLINLLLRPLLSIWLIQTLLWVTIVYLWWLKSSPLPFQLSKDQGHEVSKWLKKHTKIQSFNLSKYSNILSIYEHFWPCWLFN